MFEPSLSPRVYGMPPGVDFPKALVQGLMQRMAGASPQDMARVTIYVNTRRMARRVATLFDDGPALLLPQIKLVTELADPLAVSDLPPPISGLRRQLELAQLIERLILDQPELAPRAAVFDLAESLAALFDEIEGEGVPVENIFTLDVTDSSGHWERSLGFIRIVSQFLDQTEGASAEARQRLSVLAQIAHWEVSPPTHPILIAGSTGSRGTTALLMEAAAQLPQGAVILPGFDFEMPDHGWRDLRDENTSEDHPQFRLSAFLQLVGLSHSDVGIWSDEAAPCPARNRLVSLALRPAPVTDSWLSEGPDLGDLATATDGMTLLEAPTPRAEANAIALRLRQAAETGEIAALITPDRTLTRQVAAALDRWDIIPDDSAGRPLSLTAPGRFLRHVAGLGTDRISAEDLLILLKHPLCNTGSNDRGPHLLWTRELELWCRREGPPFPSVDDLSNWAALRDHDDGREAWAAWLGRVLQPAPSEATPLEQLLADHIALTEHLSAGPASDGSGELWREAAGRAAFQAIEDIRRDAPYGGALLNRDYFTLISKILSGKEARNQDEVRSKIMIWGTLEARVQGADLVILGGLNDGIWPAAPTPDPWLNRKMRKEARLLLPERRIGLSAHDFQQALGAKTVWLSRSVRNDEAETVPSRWLNRLLNLTRGLPEQGGPEAVDRMKARGDTWLALAARLDLPKAQVDPAFRPSPCPPDEARPRSLSVTQVKTLIRDPYAIYAQRVLRLRRLDPLRQSPDAPLRGTILHSVFEAFIKATPPADLPSARALLIEITDQVLEADAPWPTARRLWRAKLHRVADWFLEGEAERQTKATPIAFETKGKADLTDPIFTLTAKADRMDRTPDGAIYIYDYKTGKPPSAKEQGAFDKQLLLSSAMVEYGAFKDIGPADVRDAAYIGVGTKPEVISAPLDEIPTARVWAEFTQLISAYLDASTGFTARRAVAKEKFGGDFDQLARFGEWDTSMPARKERLT